MTKNFSFFLIHWICLVVLAFSAPVLAEGQVSKKKVRYTKSQDVSFEDQEIQGALRSPDGAFVNPQRGTKYAPLYKVDQQFEKEIKDSVEYLN